MARFSMPAASDDLMHSFYPLLANAMIQADLNSVEDEGSAAVGEPRPCIITTYCLSCLRLCHLLPTTHQAALADVERVAVVALHPMSRWLQLPSQPTFLILLPGTRY